MTDFTLVDPRGWEYDLHSVYSAYIGYFQIQNVPWYDRSWGHLFESFEAFLAFSWPVITVTDAISGRAHIVTRLNSIGAFIKMIKTRFGETLPQAPNILQVTPFETAARHLRHVADYPSYKKLHSTLPAVILSAVKTRIKVGDPRTIKEIWDQKDKTFLAISFELSERNEKSALEWGYAAVRCAHLETMGQWPPLPDTNYRKGHYIVAEYADKAVNKHTPNHPWKYAFGESQLVPKAKLPQIIQAVFSSLASPNSETTLNQLVLVGHNISSSLARFEEMKIKLPLNMLVIDTMIYERSLYSSGFRGVMQDPKCDRPRISGSSLSFENLLYSLTLPGTLGSDKMQPAVQTTPLVLPHCMLHNAGNDAFMCLFALQKLLDPIETLVPSVRKLKPSTSISMISPMSNAATAMPVFKVTASSIPYPGAPFPAMQSITMFSKTPRPSTAYDLASEFGQMQLNVGQEHSGSSLLTSSARPVNNRRLHSFPSLHPNSDGMK